MIKFDHSQNKQEDAMKFNTGETLAEVIQRIGDMLEPTLTTKNDLKASEKIEQIINSEITREELAFFLQRTVNHSFNQMDRLKAYEFLYGELTEDKIQTAIKEKVSGMLTTMVQAVSGKDDMIIATGEKPSKEQIIKDMKEILGEDANFFVEQDEVGMQVRISKKHQTPENMKRIEDYFKAYTKL